MRLPGLGSEHTTASHTRRQANFGGTITNGDLGPDQGPNIGLSIVIPLVSGFGGIVLLSSVFLAWFTFRRRRQRAASTDEERPLERTRLGAKKKLPTLSIPVLALLPIVKFEVADQGVSRAEKSADPTSQEEGSTLVTETSTTTSQSQDKSPEDTDSQNLQRPEPAHLDSSFTSNPASSPEEGDQAPPTLSEDQHPPWRGDFTTCTICEEDFQIGQDVRLLPCNHGFHPACIDFWLLNRSATCPLWLVSFQIPSREIETDDTS